MDRSTVYFSTLFIILAATAWKLSQSKLEWISAAASRIPLHIPFSNDQHNQSTSDDWNILYHLGGNGPWIRKTDNVMPGGIDVPAGCRVDQVHMVGPHT